MKNTTKLRELIKKGVVFAPGAWDVLSAKMIEKMGFQAAYMTGFGVSMSLIGKTDLGYINRSEMFDSARRITEAIDIPLISDVDDGFGNPLDVYRTITLAQKIGIAAVQMEDMERPKRCSHLGGGRLASTDLMVNKIKAAVAAKSDADFVIIARTDNYEGVDEAMRRAKLYVEAGADMIMPVALTSKEDYAKVSKAVFPVPLLSDWVGGGKSPQLSMNDCESLNVKIVAFALDGFAQAYQAWENHLKQLRVVVEKKDQVITVGNSFATLHEFEDMLDMARDVELQLKYFPKR